MKTLRYVVCDVFTDRPLAGNQLAVFTDAGALPGEMMQALAREMSFSETVFLSRPEQGGHARLRIFTPTREVPFAGHPVLGTAFVVAGPITTEQVRLETGMGTVLVQLTREGGRVVFGWMQQPIPSVKPFERSEELLAALGVTRSMGPIETYDNGIAHTYVELESREQVAGLEPDFAKLAKLPTLGVSAFAGSGFEFKTRMFAPAGGVNEDPATGSAAGPLALHLARHGRTLFGDEIRIEQGAELGRPSVLFARATGQRERVETVEVGGSAVIVARGEFRI
ncbi:MAG: PhzF family phenazine biosynthesis protein [Myxococcales bacterium]|nr:PhzF family phenazine biosynthesis protein [Myxococcales bacterium]